VSSSEPVTGADAAETALLDKLQAGDETAYATLVQCYGGVMLNTVRRIVKHEEDAHDCLQDAFLQAFRKLHLFERRSSLKTWLHRLAVNSALMKVRARKRKEELALEDWMSEYGDDGHRIELHRDFSESVETLFLRQATRALVQQAIDDLPDQYRIVLLLRDIEGHDTEEVAVLLETSIGSIKTRLHRARAALKKKLEPLFAGDIR
jgi:RNA polymerase sigma-70 factor (ECF subfamily)